MLQACYSRAHIDYLKRIQILNCRRFCQAAKEDRDLKSNVPIQASQGIGSLKKVDAASDSLGSNTLAAAKEDIIAKALLKEVRSNTAALASVTPLEALSHVCMLLPAIVFSSF